MMDMAYVGGAQRVDKIFGEQAQSLRPKPLRPSTEARLVELMEKRSSDFVKLMLDGPSTLRFVREKRGVALLEGHNHKKQYMVKATTTVQGSVEDILLSFQMNNTWDFDTTMHKFFDLYANKGATLSTVASQPIAVHWMSLNTDKIESRDFVFASHARFYEHTDAGLCLLPFTSRSDATSGSLVWESVDLAKEIPLLRQTTTGCTRYYFRHAGFYVETTSEDDTCRVSFALSLDNDAGSVGGSKWMHNLALSLENLARALRRIELVPKEKWHHREHCTLCKKSFRAFRRRHHCRLCGESICGDCSKTMQLDTPVIDHGQRVELTSLRSCLRCFDTCGSSSSDRRSRSSTASFEYTRSFDEPRTHQSTSSSANLTKSFASSSGSFDESVKPRRQRLPSSSQASVVSASEISALDELLGTSLRSVDSSARLLQTKGSFVNLHPVNTPTPPVAETDRESLNSLDDRSSSGSEVYVLDDENGFDVSAGGRSAKRPASPSSAGDVPVQPQPEPLGFVVFDGTKKQPSEPALVSDMIKLQM
ncbi:hypothetical protein SDRG_00490 [Saprolegnia diclina VS20]|uniref:FYVE-type domain-containing protein n=1 Tax=Saprolegnia diclina (strain VS20) TaxID=1156394 RepID=T0SIK0_SAPDV|nr:hypothetical protein SDRG_00490 [Saprolegnia diclina VS20]EQC42767.1 hypothetical protein SDRG_00490 [Saprolegnia diclina VS20]|eukprot:XP_008604190.1 hypothetical protein SDRG_00490 [Saprolegnia diclina VS20]